MIKIPVFVYGSLKRGFHNHHYLKDATFICGGIVQNRGWMYDLGGFPAAKIARRVMGGHYIVGELYDVSADTLASLDRLEGNGHFYTRSMEKIVKFSKKIDRIVPAWIYLINSVQDGTLLVDPTPIPYQGYTQIRGFNWQKNMR